MGDRVRARVVVSGRVQGVAFRAAAADEAERLGVTGWVRNRDDGDVEAVVEGERPQVEALLAWCRRGPPAARVENVTVRWEEHRGEFGAFRITH